MASVHQPANKEVIRYLQRLRGVADDRSPRPQQLDYWELGSHPDVVERVWDQLGKSLPMESRRVVCGSPALVHPTSKLLLAVAIGTAYALRLPGAVLRSGVPSSVLRETVWSGGDRLNVEHEFGSDWIIGNYDREEEVWCRQLFEEQAK